MLNKGAPANLRKQTDNVLEHFTNVTAKFIVFYVQLY